MPCRVTDVWVNGKQLMKERELLTLDVEELKRIAEKWDKILKEFKAGQQWAVCWTHNSFDRCALVVAVGGMEQFLDNFPIINVVNVNVLDNPSSITNPFQFEIIFEARCDLEDGGPRFLFSLIIRPRVENDLCGRLPLHRRRSGAGRRARGPYYPRNSQVLLSSRRSRFSFIRRQMRPIWRLFRTIACWA